MEKILPINQVHWGRHGAGQKGLDWGICAKKPSFLAAVVIKLSNGEGLGGGSITTRVSYRNAPATL